jgi:hypothetical protein
MRDLEALTAPIVVCVPGDYPGLADDLFGACLLCDGAIRWRPHLPAGSRVCLCCFIVNARPGHFDLAVTAETLEELAGLGVWRFEDLS